MKLLKKQSSQLIVTSAMAAIFLVGCGSLGAGKSSSKNKLLPGKPPLQMHQIWELTLICGERP